MAKVESNTGVLPLVLYPAVFPLRGENTGLPGDPNALRGRREGGREKVKMADGGPFSFWSGGGGGGGAGEREQAFDRACFVRRGGSGSVSPARGIVRAGTEGRRGGRGCAVQHGRQPLRVRHGCLRLLLALLLHRPASRSHTTIIMPTALAFRFLEEHFRKYCSFSFKSLARPKVPGEQRVQWSRPIEAMNMESEARKAGRLWACGSNSSGQCGIGKLYPTPPEPQNAFLRPYLPSVLHKELIFLTAATSPRVASRRVPFV